MDSLALGQRIADELGLIQITEWYGNPVAHGWWNWMNGPGLSENGRSVRLNAFGWELLFRDGPIVEFVPKSAGRTVSGKDLLWLVRLDHALDGLLSVGLDRADEGWLAATIRCHKFHPGAECLWWKVNWPNNEPIEDDEEDELITFFPADWEAAS